MQLQSEFSREFLKTIFARLPPLASAARCGQNPLSLRLWFAVVSLPLCTPAPAPPACLSNQPQCDRSYMTCNKLQTARSERRTSCCCGCIRCSCSSCQSRMHKISVFTDIWRSVSAFRPSVLWLLFQGRVPRTNCALWIKKCAPRISSGIDFLSTS